MPTNDDEFDTMEEFEAHIVATTSDKTSSHSKKATVQTIEDEVLDEIIKDEVLDETVEDEVLDETENESYDVNEVVHDRKTHDNSPVPSSSLGLTLDDFEKSSFSGEPSITKNEKVAFGSLEKNKYTPGKLNKQRILIFLSTFILAVVIFFNVAFIKQKEEEKANSTNSNLDTYYEPNFGDYNNRGYKGDEEIEEIEKLLNPENPAPFVRESAPSREGNAPQAMASSPVQSVQSGYSENEMNAMRSKLKLDAAGFGKVSTSADSSAGLVPTIASSLGLMSQEEYADTQLDMLSPLLDKIGGIGGNSAGSSPSATTVSNQSIINHGRESSNGAFDFQNTEGGAITALNEYTLYPGTIIPAALISGINTDYPAGITARVISPVYDSRTGNTLLIPAGSILRGGYSSSSFGVAKVQIAWTELIVNRSGIDYLVSLGNMAGVDSKGQAGIKGSLDEHYWEYLKAIGIMSAFTILNSELFYYSDQFSEQSGNNSLLENVPPILDGTQEMVNDLGNKLFDRALDIQPTVTVKNGTRVNVEVNAPLTLIPFEKDVVNGRYIRR